METISYEAGLDRDYLALTDKHKSIVVTIESALTAFIQHGKAKPITIQGPYGSGKTQLLYHLFKYVWDKGAIGIYTHLEKLVPKQVIMSSGEYTTYLKHALDEEVQALLKGDSKLMSGELSSVRQYALNRIAPLKNRKVSVFLFVDEIEQQYKILDERVRTDDHSPMKEILRTTERGDAGFYMVLAFAPVSFYEFSKGEAQTRSFLPLMLPVLTAANLREMMGGFSNLVWWMGRGRYGWALKVFDTLKANIQDMDICQKKEFLDICRNLGSIGGVPCLVEEQIEIVDDFEAFRNFLVRIAPHHEGNEIYSGDTKAVKKCRVLSPQHDVTTIIQKSLKDSKIVAGTDISYYLTLILEAMSGPNKKIPIFTDAEEWRELLSMVGDITLEFEGQERTPTIELERLQSDSDFPFNVRRYAEDIASLEEGYCICPRYIRSLFPFPISSPNLVNKKIAEQRETLGDQTFLAREEHNSISVIVFLNDSKAQDYLSNHIVEFLEETKALLVISLSDGDELSLPSIAKWLQKEERLRIARPRGIISDFLVSFHYWLRSEKGETLPLQSLSDSLSKSEVVADKEKARKIKYYASRVGDYIEGEKPRVLSSKYLLKDRTGFDSKIGFAREVMGFAFVENKQDWEALYEFRKTFEKTEFVRRESTSKLTGVPTALQNLVVEAKGKILPAALLRRVNESLNKHLPDLRDVVKELDMDKFASIPVDEPSKVVFQGIYLFLKDFHDPSISVERLREAQNAWDRMVSRMETLANNIVELEKLFYGKMILTHPLAVDQTRITSMSKIVASRESKISPYSKFLLALLMNATREVVEPELNKIEKRFQEFKNDVEDDTNRYAAVLKSFDSIDDDTFQWLGKSKTQVLDECAERIQNACEQLLQGGKLSLENVPDLTNFMESISEIADDLETLSEIDNSISISKAKAKEIGRKLQTWGAK